MTVVEYFFSEKEKTEFAIWTAGLLLGSLAVIVLLLDRYTPFSLESLRYDCWVRSRSGILCPGCGGTRAFLEFVSGRWIASIWLHPVVPYMGVLYIIFMLRGALHFLSRGRFDFMRFRLAYVYVGIAIILVQFVVKNVCLFGFHILWI